MNNKSYKARRPFDFSGKTILVAGEIIETKWWFKAMLELYSGKLRICVEWTWKL